jgi:DNA-binding response OmpR family regulator
MTTPHRILIVEDDRSIAIAYGIHLVEAGYTVQIAEDGVAALQNFASQPPSLVILDLQVPLVSGYRLLRVIKRQSASLPVLVATSLAFQEAEEVARAGADDFLTKPVHPDLLVETVGRHLLGRPAAIAASGGPGDARELSDYWRGAALTASPRGGQARPDRRTEPVVA